RTAIRNDLDVVDRHERNYRNIHRALDPAHRGPQPIDEHERRVGTKAPQIGAIRIVEVTEILRTESIGSYGGLLAARKALGEAPQRISRSREAGVRNVGACQNV